jgi:hypothetical protein
MKQETNREKGVLDFSQKNLKKIIFNNKLYEIMELGF